MSVCHDRRLFSRDVWGEEGEKGKMFQFLFSLFEVYICQSVVCAYRTCM